MNSPAIPVVSGRLRTGSRAPLLVLLAVLVATAICYTPSLDGEFQLDDGRVIERSAQIRDVQGALRTALERGVAADRPLVTLTFAVDYARSGLAPRAFHVTNLLFHLAAVVAVFLLGLRLTRIAGSANGGWVAVAAAVAFALHPIQSAAVSYVVQRSEILASLLYVVVLLLLLEADRRGPSVGGGVAAGGALLAFVLALASKDIAITAPVGFVLATLTLPGSAAAPARRTFWKLGTTLPIFLVAIGWGVVKLGALASGGGHDGGFSVPGLPPSAYALTQLRVLVTYLRLLVLPVGQNVDWDVAPSASLLEPATAAAAAALLALVATAAWGWWRARRAEGDGASAVRLAAFGLLWFFLVLSPTSSVVPLADVLVEHRLYLASWGILLALAAGAERGLAALGPRRAARVGLVVSLVVAVALGGALWRRSALWATRLALWSDAVSKSPAKARPWAEVALAQEQEGQVDEAVRSYRASLSRVRSTELEMEVQVRRNFSALLASTGRADEALSVLQRALALAPSNAEIAANMGLAHLQRGDLATAAVWIDRALSLDPALPEPHGLQGSVRLRQGDAAGAAVAFEAAARLAPDVGAYPFNQGLALERLGKRAEACALWRSAAGRRLDPVLAERVPRILASACR